VRGKTRKWRGYCRRVVSCNVFVDHCSGGDGIRPYCWIIKDSCFLPSHHTLDINQCVDERMNNVDFEIICVNRGENGDGLK
jgi:hypothetical protein